MAMVIGAIVSMAMVSGAIVSGAKVSRAPIPEVGLAIPTTDY